MSNNIFEEGALVNLTVSIWGGRKKLPVTQMQVEADPDFIRGTKYLVEREVLKPIEQIRNSARSFLRDHSLPFPITGVAFIPKTLIDRMDRQLSQFKENFGMKVEDFLAQYENAKTVARIKLNGLYCEEDYPENIGTLFNFSWQFFTLSAPGRVSIINPEIMRREEARFLQMMSDFRENAVNVLRIRFSEMVSRIVDRLSGEEKRFKNTTITNIQEFLDAFTHLNINNDESLKCEVERVKAILTGVDPGSIRSDSGFRASVAGQMSKVQDSLESMTENLPRRKLMINREEEESKVAA